MSHVPITFVNSVAVTGFLNGIINVGLSTAQFLPTSDGEVVAAEIVTANLRMDLLCAQQLHDSLARILAQQVKPASKDLQ